MNPRDTRTGIVLEKMILPALQQGGYQFRKQVEIGKRLGGRKHKVDILITTREGQQIPVSLKWQQTSGTAEQKVPYEIMCLAEAVHGSQGKYTKAYLVLGGEGWSLRDLYLGIGLKKYLKNCEPIEVVSLETFVARSNQGKL